MQWKYSAAVEAAAAVVNTSAAVMDIAVAIVFAAWCASRGYSEYSPEHIAHTKSQRQ